MRKISRNQTEKILTLILIALFSLFCFSLFKNIQYPLLWNDEADTAMFATRILKYGYPKVHDGKNILLSQAPLPVLTISVSQKLDAMIDEDWLQYYFASLILTVASGTKDIYLQTAILRSSFAIIGLVGLAILVISVTSSLVKKSDKLLFINLFLFLELLSISLILHLREVRYYSLIILWIASLFYVFFRYHIFKDINYKSYSLLIILINLLILITYHPIFFPTLIFLFSLACLQLFVAENRLTLHIKQNIKKVQKQLVPPIVTLIFAIPYLVFFNKFNIALEMSKHFRFDLALYLKHIRQEISFFWQNELLLTAIVLQFCSLLLYFFSRRYSSTTINQKVKISCCLSSFFILCVLFIARIPYQVLFTRYFIVLQPLLTIIVSINLLTIFELQKILHFNKFVTRFMMILILGYNVIFHNSVIKSSHIVGYIYELFHKYHGPIDYIVSYINTHYYHPENLIIATNYEEYSLMFYLKSKVTIGYIGNNLKEDIKIQPDIIIYRTGWNNHIDIFRDFLKKGKYKMIIFPIADYPVNNIPDFNFIFPHLFKTRLTSNENERLAIFVRQEN